MCMDIECSRFKIVAWLILGVPFRHPTKIRKHPLKSQTAPPLCSESLEPNLQNSLVQTLHREAVL